MNIGVAVVVGCLIQIPAHACESGQHPCKDAATPFAGRHPVHAVSIRELLRPATDRSLLTAEIPNGRARMAGGPVYESTFARAIARAAKRSAAELAIEAATKIIVMCQKERNPALTTPFFRSDSQQAHCFRY